ncbi:hypothetical protein VCHA53O466_50049 [Vibrio chagasii]|nr:hypothetical protein VCHA53O466_50049 [Vibrio chagasii]
MSNNFKKVFISAGGWCHAWESNGSYTFVASTEELFIPKMEIKGGSSMFSKLLNALNKAPVSLEDKWLAFCSRHYDTPMWDLTDETLEIVAHNSLKTGDKVKANIMSKDTNCIVESIYKSNGHTYALLTINLSHKAELSHPLIEKHKKCTTSVLLSCVDHNVTDSIKSQYA